MSSKQNNIETIREIVINKRDTVKKHKILIDSVRRCCSNDKTYIAKYASVSWPTINNFLSTYSNEDNSNDNIVTYEDDIYKINSEYGVFLGVAVGAVETKVTLVDFAFDALVSEEKKTHRYDSFFEKIKKIQGLEVKESPNYMVCYKTKNELDYISRLCNEIVEAALDFFSSDNIPNLLGIGITFPGIMGKNDLKVSFCPNISCLNGVYLLKLFQQDVIKKINANGVSLCISHDTLAIAVYEKENLYKIAENYQYKDKENVISIYLGIGLGLGVIINNQLLTGNNNSIGEIGHIPGPDIEGLQLDDTEKCHCNVNNCIEKLIRVNVFQKTTAELLLGENGLGDLKNFHIDNPTEYGYLKSYLKYLFTIIINLFNPDLIILCGRTLNSISALKSDKYILKQSSAITQAASNCDIINGSDRADCVAIGAAIMSYYKLIESNGSNDESGMQFNIKWNKLPE